MISFDNLTLQDPSKIKESKIFDNNEFNNFLTTNLRDLLLVNIHLPAYELSLEQINWINEFIKSSPACFDKIISDLQSITSSGEIELNNIPQIIKLLADIYYSGAINYNLVIPENIISFIKFTLDVMINSQLLILPTIEKEIIKELIDTSLSLLSMNINSIEENIKIIESSSSFFGCLKFFNIK